MDIESTVRVQCPGKQVLLFVDVMKAMHTHTLRKGECYAFIDERFFT